MRFHFTPLDHPVDGRGQRRRFRHPVHLAAVLVVAGCAAINPIEPGERPTPLALFQPAATAEPIQFQRDHLICRRQSGTPLPECLTGLGHAPVANAVAAAVIDNAYFGVPEPQPMAIAVLGPRGFYTGATELFPRTTTSPIILNRVGGTGRCDGTANLVRPSAVAGRLGGDAILLCENNTVVRLRLTLDTPQSGHGVGQDVDGATYAVLFGPPALAAKANHDRLRDLLADMRPPTGQPAAPSAKAVRAQFQADDYRLNRVRTGAASVPNRFLAALPGDLASDPQTLRRKDVFIKLMLPLVLLSNEVTLADRAHMLQLISRLDKGLEVTTTNQLWLNRLAARFETAPDDFPTLRYRIDAVPPSLAIAQAALETGWGTSRFSHQGNALFGEWTFGESRGIVPASRTADQDHKIRAFDSLLHSVLAYMDNLNSHPAYRDFRAHRARKRALGQPVSGRELTPFLTAYGGDTAYVDKVRTVINANRLRHFDDAQLSRVPVFGLPQPQEKPTQIAQNTDSKTPKSLSELFLK